MNNRQIDEALLDEIAASFDSLQRALGRLREIERHQAERRQRFPENPKHAPVPTLGMYGTEPREPLV